MKELVADKRKKRRWKKLMGNTNLNNITEKIIASAFEVSNTLGVGFLEKVYERSMLIELENNGLNAESQKPLTVLYQGEPVGEYFIDILVEDAVVVEIKSAKFIDTAHEAQLLNHLKASGKKVELVFNFGKPKVEIRRLVNNF